MSQDVGIIEPPFFSVAVTTYDRVDLLRETLASILDQTFADFEIVVGNNNPARLLSADTLGSNDPRINILNHPKNLGQLGNMIRLQESCRGKYITWIADDDLYARTFLEAAHNAIIRYENPICVFTGFRNGTTVSADNPEIEGKDRILTGPEFLRQYLQRKIRTIGTMGLFRSDYLSGTGELEDLSHASIAIYTEYLQLIKAGTLERVVFIDAPLVIFRDHPESFSNSAVDLRAYRTAQDNVIRRSLEVLATPPLLPDFSSNSLQIFRFFLMDFLHILWRAGAFKPTSFVGYLVAARRHLAPLKGTNRYWEGSLSLAKAEASIVWAVTRQKLKAAFTG